MPRSLTDFGIWRRSTGCPKRSAFLAALRPAARGPTTLSHRYARAPVGVHTTPCLFTHPRNVSAHALSSPRGIGILAPAPRCDQRAGGRRSRRIPPTHYPHTRGTDAARLPSRQLSSSPVHPPSTIIARHPCRKSSPRKSSQQPLRLRAGGWATKERLLRPRLRNRGAPAPRGAGADRARPPGSPPHSVALHARRFDPERQLRAPRPSRTKPRMHAGVSESAPNPEPPERGRSGGLTPPPQAPAAALRRARPPPSDVGRAPHLHTTLSL